MHKIIIISSTNRPNSNTLKVSRVYLEIIKSMNLKAEILDLNILPETIAFSESFGKRTEGFQELINKYISPNNIFVFVVPEYNGGFPGILKLFIDCISPKEWTNKYACLVGVSLGRAGNLRGMDHFTSILNYLKMHVFHNKLPISGVDRLFDEKGKLNSEDQMNACVKQTETFIDWIKMQK